MLHLKSRQDTALSYCLEETLARETSETSEKLVVVLFMQSSQRQYQHLGFIRASSTDGGADDSADVGNDVEDECDEVLLNTCEKPKECYSSV